MVTCIDHPFFIRNSKPILANRTDLSLYHY